jgi:hypothetical protein
MLGAEIIHQPSAELDECQKTMIGRSFIYDLGAMGESG